MKDMQTFYDELEKSDMSDPYRRLMQVDPSEVSPEDFMAWLDWS